MLPPAEAMTSGEELVRAKDMPAPSAPTATPKVSARAEGLALAVMLTRPLALIEVPLNSARTSGVTSTMAKLPAKAPMPPAKAQTSADALTTASAFTVTVPTCAVLPICTLLPMTAPTSPPDWMTTKDAPAATAPMAAPMVWPCRFSLTPACTVMLAAPLTVEPEPICATLLVVLTRATTPAPSPTKPPPPATENMSASWSR